MSLFRIQILQSEISELSGVMARCQMVTAFLELEMLEWGKTIEGWVVFDSGIRRKERSGWDYPNYVIM